MKLEEYKDLIVKLEIKLTKEKELHRKYFERSKNLNRRNRDLLSENQSLKLKLSKLTQKDLTAYIEDINQAKISEFLKR